MEIVLLERIEKLGQIGDCVQVRDGYARNFLLPRRKALRATPANLERFEKERAQLEAHNLKRKAEAEDIKTRLDGQSFVILRQASEAGQLYGSVTTRDIAEAVTSGGFTLEKGQVRLERPVKELGIVQVQIILHPEVTAIIRVNVARSQEEAQAQMRGENVLTRDDEEELDASAFFENEELAAAALDADTQGEETPDTQVVAPDETEKEAGED